ncbi:hypothetical protein THRCLA_21544 [Thraustotheca clavata]|uniref:Translation initiation factor 3 N-terminal domain-containing protein n=1 Tax=Thraustotheca clavata TaxID=74557 RepID=A0A1V9ZVE6_9STRA|nr:hypothetical protein THRCLA_21544 [Thraustotheca clavata]
MLQRVVQIAGAVPRRSFPLRPATPALQFLRHLSANRTKRVPLNEEIRSPIVNVVDDDGNIRDAVDKRTAVKEAKKKGVDLVQVALQPPKTPGGPPIVLCKMFNFRQKSQATAKVQTENRMKGDKDVEYKANIAANDELVKNKRVKGFLENGHPVNLIIAWGNRFERRPMGLELYDRILAFLDVPYVVGKFKVNNNGVRARLNPTKRATAKNAPQEYDDN